MDVLARVTIRLITFSSIISLCGCGENSIEGTTLVEGQVVERQGRQPVSGAKIQVYQASSAGGYSAIGDPYQADVSGHFSFHFEAERRAEYLLKASASPGYITDWGEAPNLTGGRKNKGLVIPVLAPAWVRLQLVDVPPKNRILMFTTGYGGSGDQLYYPRDTTFIRPLFAGFDSQIIWVIREGGLPTQYSQNIQPMPLDTVTVRIAF